MADVKILDNEDDWMTIHVDGVLWFEDHMHNMNNRTLVELLSLLGHTVEHKTDPNAFQC